MAALPYRKVDRNQICEEISNMIRESKEGEVEVSSSELADKFGVQAPTMDYHLGKLIDGGLLSVSPKRGRYNRKIYRLPANANVPSKPKAKVMDTSTPESAEQFKRFLAEHVKKTKEVAQEKLPLEEKEEVKAVVQPKPEIKIAPEVKVEKPNPIVVKPLTLDDRITDFLKQSGEVHDANVLLKHADKEILSVMNESIHQTTLYLKDLSEQLSTVQNKQLIQGLIDDRNRVQKQMEHLEKEASEARSQADKTIEKYEVDPTRIRFMHQMIIATVDQYVNQPNHSLALGRTDFRNKVSKEVSDLVKYILHLED